MGQLRGFHHTCHVCPCLLAVLIRDSFIPRPPDLSPPHSLLTWWSCFQAGVDSTCALKVKSQCQICLKPQQPECTHTHDKNTTKSSHTWHRLMWGHTDTWFWSEPGQPLLLLGLSSFYVCILFLIYRDKPSLLSVCFMETDSGAKMLMKRCERLKI